MYKNAQERGVNAGTIYVNKKVSTWEKVLWILTWVGVLKIISQMRVEVHIDYKYVDLNIYKWKNTYIYHLKILNVYVTSLSFVCYFYLNILISILMLLLIIPKQSSSNDFFSFQTTIPKKLLNSLHCLTTKVIIKNNIATSSIQILIG